MPPPGKGLTTMTGTFPVAAVAAAGMLAVKVVPALETVPERVTPLKSIDAPVTKFVPVTVRVATG